MAKRLWLLWTVVIAGICSCEDILEEVDISNREVVLFAPLDSTVINSNAINFNWDGVKDATAYRFQLALPNFTETQQFVLDSIFQLDTLNQVATQLQLTLENGNYEWRVKALNSNFETPYSISAFVVAGEDNLDLLPPNRPQLVAPIDGTNQDNAIVNFSWTREDVPGTAERDSIYFYSDAELQNLVGKDLGANKTFSASFTAGIYFWFVTAFDTAGNESEDSEVFSFIIN